MPQNNPEFVTEIESFVPCSDKHIHKNKVHCRRLSKLNRFGILKNCNTLSGSLSIHSLTPTLMPVLIQKILSYKLGTLHVTRNMLTC